MVEIKETDQPFAFFNQVQEFVWSLDAILNTDEHWMFKHWLSLYNTEYATYELKRARVRTYQENPITTIEEVDMDRPIDVAIQQWRNIITNTDEGENPNHLLVGAAFCGRWIR